MNAEKEESRSHAAPGPAASAEEGELSVDRIAELLGRVGEEGPPDVAWELSVHVNSLSEAVRDLTVRVGALEEENRTLQDRLASGHKEYAQLRESMDELLNLHELSEAISTSFKIADILEALMDLSGRVIDYESCGVFALAEEGKGLTSMAVRGAGSRGSPDTDGADNNLSFDVRVQAQWDDGIIDWVLKEGRPVVIDDMESVRAAAQKSGRSFVIIPLMVGGKEIGVFTLYCRKAKDDFTLGEIELLGVLANQTAAAIENSRLYTDLEISHQRLKESQRQLLMSAKQAAIGELAGGVAHEVNNPLQIILSRVQLMIAQSNTEEKVTDGLRLIETNVRRISKIIRALLGFASHNTANAEWMALDMQQAILQASELVKHQLDAQLIEVEIDVPDDLPPMLGNIGELEQVFINLMLNAQNAMPDGGRLQISARRDGGQVEIRFRDSGEGIRAEHLDRIFEPFFTTRVGEGGTGLGLAVSYRIVDAHEGTITVDSASGEGSTFIVRMPIRKGEAVTDSSADTTQSFAT